MQISDPRKELFGYNKNDVFRYLAELNKEFTERMKESEAISQKKTAELERKCSELEGKIAVLKRENEDLRSFGSAVSKSVSEARKFAEQLRRDALDNIQANEANS